MSMSRAQAGKLGGETTFLRHGSEHMSKIGKKGARVLHARYRISPVRLNDYALVDRETNKIKAYLNGGNER